MKVKKSFREEPSALGFERRPLGRRTTRFLFNLLLASTLPVACARSVDTVMPMPDEAETPSAVSAFARAPTQLPTIDMLVVYTPNARRQQGGDAGIKALINQGISDANRAFQDSGANVRVRLVGTLALRQNESGDLSHDLYALQNKSDGIWDEVHSERIRVHAAQVTLVGVYAGVVSPTGIAFYQAHANSAFSVLKTSAFSEYTLVHELGHNLGLDHSDGYVSAAGKFSTIMSYGNVKRICRFSNPTLRYNGFATGDATHNEVAILNRNAATVAGFRAY